MMDLEQHLPDDLRRVFTSLNTPNEIQKYLDSVPYVGEEANRSPLRVMQERQCHCLDGGLLAAAALRRLGYPPVIIDLVPEPGADDDHVLAIFQQNGLYGALAKSNCSGLRSREPVYRSLRELVMSYFELFFNLDRQKTLRGYTRPLNLAQFDRYHWTWDERGVAAIVKRMYSLKPIRLFTPESISRFQLMDQRAYESGMLGVNLEGVFHPKVND